MCIVIAMVIQIVFFTSTCLKITDFKTPIVLDTGSGLMKAGFANEDLPNVVFPTIIGMPKYEVGISSFPFTHGTELILVSLLGKPAFYVLSFLYRKL